MSGPGAPQNLGEKLGKDSGYFIPADCLIASVASDTPIFVTTSNANLPADFKDSANFLSNRWVNRW
jgi:hypothetical protein